MLDAKEERKYKRLRKLSQELHLPIPEHYLELEVTDKNGKVIQTLKQRSHSWVRNAYNMMFTVLAGKNATDATFGAGKLSLRLTSGSVGSGSAPIDFGGYNVDVTTWSYGYRAIAGDATRGILVGGGTNEESFEDYALQTKIANGTGAGQLSYVLSETHAISYDAPTKVFKNTLVRYFNNNSDGAININEVALAVQGALEGARIWIQSRDKLGATVTIPATGQLKVTYTIALTYPA